MSFVWTHFLLFLARLARMARAWCLGPAVKPVHQPLFFSKLLLVSESPRDINHLADACLVVLDLRCIYSTQFGQ